MPYARSTISRINKAPRSLGNKLGRAAVTKEISVLQLSTITGACRQTVYNWLLGGVVLSPYQPVVQKLTRILEEAKTTDQAWSRACREFTVNSKRI